MEITFGQLVKAHRQKSGLTQKQLAYRIGCAPVTLRKIEYDALRPSSQIAEALAAALEISSEKRAAFVRFARGQHSLSDVSHLSLDEINTKVTPADPETTSIAALTAADNPYKGLRAFDERGKAEFIAHQY